MRKGLIGLLLLVLVSLLGFKNYEVWQQPLSFPKQVRVERKEIKIDLLPPVAAQETAGKDGVAEIAGKNIFNPERKEFSMNVPEQQVKAIVRPQIFLYGVLIGDNAQFASIKSPGRPLYKGERETKTVKIGDQIGGYKVADILPDRIRMEAGGDSFEVLLYDPRAPKKHSEGGTAPLPGLSPAATLPISLPASPQVGQQSRPRPTDNPQALQSLLPAPSLPALNNPPQGDNSHPAEIGRRRPVGFPPKKQQG